MGMTTDIRVEMVVATIPAFCVEIPIKKNMTMKQMPINMADGNHGICQMPGPLNNPDWAVVVESEGEERLYLVVETKGTMLFSGALRPVEQAKIDCGREHFKALEVRESPARYVVADSSEDLLTTLR